MVLTNCDPKNMQEEGWHKENWGELIVELIINNIWEIGRVLKL